MMLPDRAANPKEALKVLRRLGGGADTYGYGPFDREAARTIVAYVQKLEKELRQLRAAGDDGRAEGA